MKSHRSAPGGSGAGGSVVIITNTLKGSPHSRIHVDAGVPVNCAVGTGGGTYFRPPLYRYFKIYFEVHSLDYQGSP